VYFQGREYFQGRGNSQGRGYFQGNSQGRGKTPNRGQNRGRGQNSSKGRDLSQSVHRICNKVGHYVEYCRTSIDKISKFHQNTTQLANDRNDDGSKNVFTSSSTLQISTNFQSDYEDAWILDSGASQRMTFRCDFFWNFQEFHLNYVFLAYNTNHTPYGKGVVKVYLLDIGERKISNVWYVPTFKKNLLSLFTIRQEGHQVIMEDGLVKINLVKKNMKTVMTRYEDGKLLRMKGTVIPRHSDFAGAVSIGISPIRLWHVRYGHLNFESLYQLQKQGMVKGLPTFKKENRKCEACIYGKQSRESFPISSWHENR
jgi:hypothetical protein